MAKRKEVRDKKGSPGALFIPAGILLGFGIGFALEKIPEGMFIGLGAGFFLWAIIEVFRKK